MVLMSTELVERKILVKDLDGHWYAIPESMEQYFIVLREDIQLAEWGSDEWYEANDDLNNSFSQYMKGDV
jgi:hypothetical protein